MIHLPRPGEPPARLSSGSPNAWGHDEVRDALVLALHGKCYLCESRRRSLQVEHLRPQEGFPEDRNSWTNLFLACGGSCNQRRIHWEKREDCEARDGVRVRWPRGGLLNPTVDADVEARIVQTITVVEGEALVTFAAGDPDDLAARNTSEELNRIHDQSREGKGVRGDIYTQHNRLLDALTMWLAALPETPARVHARAVVRARLARTAAYAGLFRSDVERRLAATPHCSARSISNRSPDRRGAPSPNSAAFVQPHFLRTKRPYGKAFPRARPCAPFPRGGDFP